MLPKLLPRTDIIADIWCFGRMICSAFHQLCGRFLSLLTLACTICEPLHNSWAGIDVHTVGLGRACVCEADEPRRLRQGSRSWNHQPSRSEALAAVFPQSCPLAISLYSEVLKTTGNTEDDHQPAICCCPAPLSLTQSLT